MGSLLSEHPHLSNKPISLGSTNLFQTPLTRTGHGPGLLLIVPHDYQAPISGDLNKTLDPDPLRKWAEEGFAVAEVRLSARAKTAVEDLQQAVKALLFFPRPTSRRLWEYLSGAEAIAALVTYTDQPMSYRADGDNMQREEENDVLQDEGLHPVLDYVFAPVLSAEV
ncbi:uncharacterized protein RAG0_14990 [Rhynchosporium agropyri]|uniref:Uncharacterized protein n=1 Tax=Rhynchosporium agropyri TaxID=914238 RepID=A0A1E1LJ94_9HELO|nr:uncharacterized protein RAG0_14990 [Rhynchosporium agropyri]